MMPLSSCSITYACKGRLWLYAAPLGMLLDVLQFTQFAILLEDQNSSHVSLRVKATLLYEHCEHCQEQYMGI